MSISIQNLTNSLKTISQEVEVPTKPAESAKFNFAGLEDMGDMMDDDLADLDDLDSMDDMDQFDVPVATSTQSGKTL